MGEFIFHQILESEQLFKCKNDEIVKYKDRITELEKRLLYILENTKLKEADIVKERANIENNNIIKESLQKRLSLISAHCDDLRKKIKPLTDELHIICERYSTLRHDITSHLKLENIVLFEVNSNIDLVNEEKYDEYCTKMKVLDEINNENTKLENTKIANLQVSLTEVTDKMNKMTEGLNKKKTDIDQKINLMEGQGFSAYQKNHIHRLNSTVACFEKDISSMSSEISKKRDFLHQFNSNKTMNQPSHTFPGVLHSSSIYCPPNKLQYSNPYTIVRNNTNNPIANNTISDTASKEINSERKVVQHIRYPQSPKSEDEMFGEDDSHLIEACEEAERMEKHMT